MPVWLDLGIVSLAVLLAFFGAWRLMRRGQTASCAKSCGSCAPSEPQPKLVQIGRSRDHR